MKRSLLAVGILAMCASGCASAMRGSTQEINIKAYDAITYEPVVCDCTLANEGELPSYMNSSEVGIIERDKDVLIVKCENNEYEGERRVFGHVNGGYVFLDFCIDFCTISGLIDGLSGSWAEYPNTINMPMYKKEKE